MTTPYGMLVYSMYVAVCSTGMIADIIIVIVVPLIYGLSMQQ